MLSQKVIGRIVIALLAVLAGLASAFGQQPVAIEQGKLIAKVVCRKDASQSYALYLPSRYTKERDWPFLFCFDPRARGSMPVEIFRDAAEEYGFIVVGSNNSRNGPNGPIRAAMEAVLDDVQSRFAIDQRRIYTTGFSGGARVACSLGLMLPRNVHGVIACCAGFPAENRPSRNLPFVFFGTAGNEDFNYQEIREVKESLDGVGVASFIRMFEGDHRWMPKEVATEAIEWMELEAMKSGRRVKDEALIGRLLNKRLDRARETLKSGKPFEAYVEFQGVAHDFKGVRDTTECEKQIQQMKDTREVREGAKRQKEIASREKRLNTSMDSIRAGLTEPENRPQSFNELKAAIADLRKQAEGNHPPDEQKMYRRVLGHINITCYYTSEELIEKKEYAQAAFNLELMGEVQQANSGLFVSISSAWAQAGDRHRALESLRKAVEKGFTDAERLDTNKGFDLLRSDPEFRKIVEEMKSRKK